jgi:hypothetical protein
VRRDLPSGTVTFLFTDVEGSTKLLTELGAAEYAQALAEPLHVEIGGTMPWVARIKEEALATIRAHLDDAAVAEAWEQGRALTADEAVALALGYEP